MLLERIGETAAKNGWNVIFCRCPMRPKEYCEHLIIPEASLSLVSLRSNHRFSLPISRTVHVRRFLKDGGKMDSKRRLLLNRTLSNNLVESAVEMLFEAKKVHDGLEKLYIESMDFEKLNEFSEKFIFSLFAE